MARDSAIPSQGFEEVLDWFDPDRQVAANIYAQLHRDLTKVFEWRGCADPEGLTDDVFDRVERKVHEVRPTYEGDPRHYFHAVANKVFLENLKKVKTQVSYEDAKLPEPMTTESNEEEAMELDECLQSCLQGLSREKRELVVGYYAKEKQAKIDHRCELAQQLGMSVETLRVQVYRIRKSLHACIEGCLKRKAQRK